MSNTVTVARYTALLAGVFYGIVHHRTLQKQKDEERVHHAVQHRQELIEKAKKAWRNQREKRKDDVVTDPEDPRFDLEKLLLKWEKEHQ